MGDAQDRLMELFNEARAQGSPEEREAYLADACRGDVALRRQVEALLKADTQAGNFLKPPSDDPPDCEGPGTVIGHYKLLQLIGEGGFGRVFMAEQLEHIRRKVAFKIIKLGMDTREVIARFEAERQALAMMDHPSIAKVFDAGVTGCFLTPSFSPNGGEGVRRTGEGEAGPTTLSSGRPYFVMELVKGIPLTDYCDQHQLPPGERLQLFLKVCHAVQHAHQKGVIHRDLKPSNILVTEQDGEAVPKIIDFGVAKAIGQPLTDKTLFTRFEQMIGTPTYMSPEQAGLGSLDVDTRTDIYALGVLLYELLTGTTPVQRETLHQAAVDEVRRLIREIEPPKPSTRLHTLGAKLTEVAARRQTEPSTLRKLVRGDLDWIVMKALEKDRRRRYDTAEAVAQDISRHLRHEPVLASPPGTLYRARKFIRRHRVGVSMAAAVSAALIVGLLASLVGFTRASRERDRAITAEMLAEAQRQHAEKEAEKSAKIVDLLRTMLRGGQAGYVRGKDFTMQKMLEDFEAKLGDTLDELPEVQAEIEDIILGAYGGLGVQKGRERHLEKKLAASMKAYGSNDVRVANILLDLSGSYPQPASKGLSQGNALLDEALRILKAKAPNSADYARALWTRGFYGLLDGCRRQGKADFDQAHQILKRIGGVPAWPLASLYGYLESEAVLRRECDEAETWRRRSIEIARKQPGSTEARAEGNQYLARTLLRQGDYRGAEIELRNWFAFSKWAYGDDEYRLIWTIPDYLLAMAAQGKSDSLATERYERLCRPTVFAQALEPAHPWASYRFRVSTPGIYALYLRWDGHDFWSHNLWAQIKELADGPGGVTDFYGFSIPHLFGGDADFTTFPQWQAMADHEGIPGPVRASWALTTPGDYTLRIAAQLDDDGVALDAIVLQLVNLPPPEGGGPPESQINPECGFVESNGRVVMEAEHFTEREETKPKRWFVIPHESAGDVPHLHHRGSGYLQTLPDHSAEDAEEVLHARAFAQAQEGRYDEAVRYYLQAVETDPREIRNYYQLALASLGAQQTERFRGVVSMMLSRFNSEDASLDPGRFPGTCLLYPDSGNDYVALLALAEEVVRDPPTMPQRAHAVRVEGAARYRAKDYDQAIAALKEAYSGYNPELSTLAPFYQAYTSYFLAMAHNRSAHTAEGRFWLERAGQHAQAYRATAEAAPPMPWFRRLTLELLHREAQSLLGQVAAPEATSSAP